MTRARPDEFETNARLTRRKRGCDVIEVRETESSTEMLARTVEQTEGLFGVEHRGRTLGSVNVKERQDKEDNPSKDQRLKTRAVDVKLGVGSAWRVHSTAENGAGHP
jgi:hypothetical protein